MAGSDDTLRTMLHDGAGDLRILLHNEDAIHAMARGIARDHRQLAPDAVVAELAKNIDLAIPQIKDAGLALRLALIGLAIRAAWHGDIPALIHLCTQFSDPALQALSPQDAHALLSRHGWLADIDVNRLSTISQPAAPNNFTDDTLATFAAMRTLRLLGLGEVSDMAYLTALYETLAVPWLLSALETGHDDCALNIEASLYNGWIRRVERIEHYKQSYARWVQPMIEAGRRYGRKLGPLRTAAIKRPLIGIYIHSANWLAHTALLHLSLSALRERAYDIRLYVGDSRNAEFERRFSDIGVTCHFLRDTMTGEKWSLTGQFTHLRALTQKDGVQVMIWLCLATGMSFAYGMGLAPRQIHWSMRSMINTITAADDYWMAFNVPGDSIAFEGGEWQATPVTMLPNPKPLQADIDAIRARYPGKTILGTLTREDKISAPAFLSAICDVLARNPEAVYLYTGRHDLPIIRDTFAARGLADRAHFVGWVDTTLYAHVFDIYIDSWPARSGVTLFNAFEAQTPCVFFMGDQGDADMVRLSFHFHELQQRPDGYHLPDDALDRSFTLPDGTRALLAYDTLAEYHAGLDRLIADPAYRKTCGQSGRALYTHLTDQSEIKRKLGRLITGELERAEAMHAAA